MPNKHSPNTWETKQWSRGMGVGGGRRVGRGWGSTHFSDFCLTEAQKPQQLVRKAGSLK